ncbi:MAG: SPOR domain-containing protein [Chromatiaceae bacterium]|nr:MAG: SPOR domain-containing protein [Chromatiaceae bacterium]
MTRDYRKGAPRPRRRNERRGTCAFWFLCGGVVGAFGVGLAWLSHAPPPEADLAATAAPAPSTRQVPPPPKFDFYNMLPEERVALSPDVPLTSAAPASPSPAPPPAAEPAAAASTEAALPPAGSGDFVIQVASYSRPGDADRLKAQLALLGIPTSVQSVTIENGQTFYRVRTGAYDRAGANAVQDRLKQNGHDALMMRAR